MCLGLQEDSSSSSRHMIVPWSVLGYTCQCFLFTKSFNTESADRFRVQLWSIICVPVWAPTNNEPSAHDHLPSLSLSLSLSPPLSLSLSLSLSLKLCSDEGLTLETSANTLFTAFTYPHQPYVDTLSVLPPRRRRPKLVLFV